MLAVILATQP